MIDNDNKKPNDPTRSFGIGFKLIRNTVKENLKRNIKNRLYLYFRRYNELCIRRYRYSNMRICL